MALSIFKDFEAGQGIGNVSNYLTYSADLDSNFAAIETMFNALEAQFQSIQGPNAGIALEVVTYDAVNSLGSQVNGVFGARSFEIIESSITTATVPVAAGAALVAGVLVTASNQSVLSASLLASTSYSIVIDGNGVASATTTPGAGDLILATISTDGSSQWLSNTLAIVGEPFFKGDDWRLALRSDGNASAGVPTEVHRDFTDRLANLERVLRAVTTNASGGTALGRIAIGGTQALPGLILGDGTTFETDSGLYRIAADRLGMSMSDQLLMEWLNGEVRFAVAARSEPTVDATFTGAETLDLASSNAFHLTLTGNVSGITLNNPMVGASYVLTLIQDGTGSRLVTWPAAIKWPGNTAPTLTTTAAGRDIITLYVESASEIHATFSLDH